MLLSIDQYVMFDMLSDRLPYSFNIGALQKLNYYYKNYLKS